MEEKNALGVSLETQVWFFFPAFDSSHPWTLWGTTSSVMKWKQRPLHSYLPHDDPVGPGQTSVFTFSYSEQARLISPAHFRCCTNSGQCRGDWRAHLFIWSVSDRGVTPWGRWWMLEGRDWVYGCRWRGGWRAVTTRKWPRKS